MPISDLSTVPRAMAPRIDRSRRVGIRPDLRTDDVAAFGRRPEIADDFRKAEQAHGDIGEADAVRELGDVEVMRPALRSEPTIDSNSPVITRPRL
jgi:hypothetical protein